MEREEEKLEEMGAFFDARFEQYDEVHTGHIDGGLESKRVPAACLPEDCRNLLDLGIGTGLELEAVFDRFPEIAVTGVDLSRRMLQKLREKYPGRNLELYRGSYFEFDMGSGRYDAALTVMTLHHYTHEVKTALYRRIREALRPGGVYVECDYMISGEECPDPQKTEEFFFAEYERLKREQGLDAGREYHYDTPCTVENQKKMLLAAGFQKVHEVWRRRNTVVLAAEN